MSTTTSASSDTPREPGPEIPWSFLDCPTDTLIVLISHMLDLLIEHNDQVVLTPDALTRFHSRQAPGITVVDYLRRIVRYTNMEKIPLLSLLAYIDTTCKHLPTFTLSTLTVHRFLIAGVCAGSKAQCDVFCTNSHYAKVGGIKVQELNALEREFLKVTEWDLCCNADLLQRYYSSLIRSHGGFTQAAEPEVYPFTTFPRSRSKPRHPVQEDEDMVPEQELVLDLQEAEGAPSGSGGGSPNQSVLELDLKGKRRSIDLDQLPINSPTTSSARGRSLRRRPSRVTGQGMDVDESPVSAAASSSIPSSAGSSRSRNLGSGPGLGLGRKVSEPKLAEARVDTSHVYALGEGSGSGGGRGSENGLEGDGRAGGMGNGHVNGVGHGDSGEGDVGKAGSGESTTTGETHHEHHRGHLLKNFVGNIFGRTHSHPHPQTEHDTSQQAHIVIRSRPLRSPDSTAIPIHHTSNSMPVLGNAVTTGIGDVGGDVSGRVKPLTPRVRSREERSLDSMEGDRVRLDRVAETGKRRSRVDLG